MKTIAHVSDLHFGRVDPATLEPLQRIIRTLSPDLVVVTGDLTQRARRTQFLEARDFLASLPQPQIVVPGNHDVPLYRVHERFLRPLGNYRQYITSDLEPMYQDEEIAVVGLNTARSLTLKDGRINRTQARRTHQRFREAGKHLTRIVATHHPFDLPEGADQGDIVGRARMVMETLAACGTDLFLAGHLHVSHTGESAVRYKIEGHAALCISAGTATSTRGRGEANSFNVIRIERPQLWLQRYSFSPADRTFALASEEEFAHTPAAGWKRGKKSVGPAA